MSRIISPIAQPDSKQIIINQLKNQIYELRKLQSDYLRLNNQMSNLEQKYSLLLDQKQRNLKQYRVKNQINNDSKIQLRQEIDALKIQIQQTTYQIQQNLRQNSSLQRMSDARANQIQIILVQNREMEVKNQCQNQQNRNLVMKIKQLKQQRNKLQVQSDFLSDMLDKNISVLKGIQKDSRNNESHNTRLDKTLLQAENDNDKLNLELAKKIQDCKRSDYKLKQQQLDINQLKNNLRSIQTIYQQHKIDCANNKASYENQASKNVDLTNNINRLDHTILNVQQQLDNQISIEQGLRKNHFNLIEENKFLNCQIDNCMSIIRDYQQVNKELICEIESFIMSDEQALMMLSRKDMMQQLIKKTYAKLSVTQNQIAHLYQ